MYCMVLIFIYIFALQTTLYRIILGNRIQKKTNSLKYEKGY